MEKLFLIIFFEIIAILVVQVIILYIIKIIQKVN